MHACHIMLCLYCIDINMPLEVAQCRGNLCIYVIILIHNCYWTKEWLSFTLIDFIKRQGNCCNQIQNFWDMHSILFYSFAVWSVKFDELSVILFSVFFFNFAFGKYPYWNPFLAKMNQEGFKNLSKWAIWNSFWLANFHLFWLCPDFSV